MIINYDTIAGRTYIRIEGETVDEVQREVNRLYGKVKFIGPNKASDKYVALGVEEK